MKRKITLLAMIFISMNMLATNYYWVGGSGSWSDYINHWATTSGGATFHNQVPQSTDNVYFDANSFSSTGQIVTVDQTLIQCADMDWTGAINTPTLLSDYPPTLKIYGSLTLVTGMILNFYGQLSMEATTAGKTFTTAGIPIIAPLTFNGIGGEYTLQDSLTSPNLVYFNNGTLNTNNQTLNIASFLSTTSSTRVLNLGSSIIKVSNHWNYGWYINSTGMTLNVGTSTIYLTNAEGDTYIVGGGLTYNNIYFTGYASIGRILDANTIHDVVFAKDGVINGGTFHDVSIAGNATINNASFNNVTIGGDGDFPSDNTFNNLTLSPGHTYTLQSNQTQTILNSLTVNGNCGALINILKSSVAGSQANISSPSGAINVSFVTLKDINATGGATFTANNAIDLGNNTGWTINTLPSKNLYWVGNSGNWDDGSHWAISSGGSPSGCSPTPVDNVFFDVHSFSQSGQTVTINAPTAYFYDMNWTGVTNNPTLTGANTLKIYGSLTLASAMTFGFSGTLSFEAVTMGHTITTAGASINTALTFNGVGGGWTLMDGLSTPYLIYLNSGSLNTNNQTVNALGVWSAVYTPRALSTGTSTFNLSGQGIWYFNPYGITVDAANANINGIPTGTDGQYFEGAGFTYHNLSFTGGTSGSVSGYYAANTFHDVSFAGDAIIYNGIFNTVTMAKQGQISGNNTFTDLILSPGHTYTLQGNATQTILNSLTVNGNCGALINILKSSDPGIQANISSPSGAINVSFVTLKDINATGGATFTANNAIDLGNNTGWTINSLPSKNLYWVGNGGNWDDGSHWASTSGGNPLGCSPTPVDNVFFDANSFSQSGQSVTVNIPTAYFNNMDWTGVSNNPTLAGANTLQVYGSLTLASAMTFGFSGTLSFEATTLGHTITTAHTPINTSLTFNGIGGGWTLQDELTTPYTIYLNNGSLNTNNQTVNILGFLSNVASVRALTTGTSTFNISGQAMWYLYPPGMTFNAAGSTIKGIAAGWYQDFYSNGFTYNDVFFTGGSIGTFYEYWSTGSTFHDVSFVGQGVIHGGSFHDVTFGDFATIDASNNTGVNNTFNNVTIAKQGNISGNNTFNNLSFSPGYTYTLGAGQTQTVNNICAQGTGSLPIRIQSSSAGVAATISKASGTMCWNYVRVSDLTGTGGAIFNAGLAPTISENMGGNTGVLFTGGCTFSNCTPCITPSITAQPNNHTVCAGSNTVFATTASGTGLTYQWQLNPGTGFTNLSNSAPYNGVTTNALNISTVTPILNGYQYRCIITDSCTNIITTSTATITIVAPPIASSSVSSSTVTVTATGGTPPYTGTGIFTGLAAGTYTYTVTDANGCTGTTTATIIATPGSHCASALPFTSPTSCINNNLLNVSGGEMWFSFTAGTANGSIQLRKNPTSLGHIHTLAFYSGTCSSLNVIDSVNVTPTNDSLLTLNESNLTAGNTYYIKAEREVTTCPSCVNTIVEFDICLNVLPPVLDFNISADSTTIYNPLTFTNNSIRFSPTTKFTWNFGDICYNGNASGSLQGNICIDTTIGAYQQISHVYNEAGVYNITLSAQDNLGNNFTLTKSIKINSSVATSTCNSGTNCDLVCNGGFENSICHGFPAGTPGNTNPSFLGYSLVDYWSNIHFPVSSSLAISGTPDYYDDKTCTNSAGIVLHNNYVPDNWAGSQLGHNNSNAYIGLYTYGAPNYREYATSKLNTQMIPNMHYNITYWVSLAEMCKQASYAPSAYFTSNAPPTQAIYVTNNVVPTTSSFIATTNIYGIITDKIGWTKIVLDYLATGNENYITLGNFSDDANSPHTSSGISTIINYIGSAEDIHLAHVPSDANGAYYYIDDISVVPVNPITLTPSQTTVCSGDPVTITASGGTGIGMYTWTFPGNTITNSGSLTVHPTTTTIYTVTSYNTTFGCSFSQTITINVNPLPNFTVNYSPTICAGTSTILSASGLNGYSYSWSSNTNIPNSPNINQATVSPIVSPTSYTVTATDQNHCSSSQVATIALYPVATVNPISNIIVSACNNPLVPQTTFSSIPSGATYTWTNSNTAIGLTLTNGIGSVPQFSVASISSPQTATITVIPTTLNGCQGKPMTYTITVNPCCDWGHGFNDHSSSTDFSAVYGSSYHATGVSFSINGTFYVTQPGIMKWDNCNVKLAADAVIDIRSGSTLYITNNSHLSACGFMWDKIIIEPGAYLHIDGNSLIEDAKTAIYSLSDPSGTTANHAGNYLLNGARLNRNYQHMVLTAFSGTHPGIIENSNFTCQSITLGTPPTLNPPYAGHRTYIGIAITNVNNTGNATGVTIGVSGNTNTFRNMDLGIRSVGSNVSVYNINFIRVNDGVASNMGAAIGAEGNAASSSYVPCNLIVGDGTIANKNTFTNCVNGIVTVQNMDSKIWLNEFYNINSQGIQVILNSQNNNALIRGNLFSNMNTGGPSGGSIAIHCQYNSPSSTKILYNQISNVFKGTGVLLEELNNMSYGAGYYVYDNQIQQVLRGVRALNVNRAAIMNNYIQTESWGGFAPPPSIGVELLGCYGMIVSSNNIQISPANITNTLNGGIYASLSVNSTISCNLLLNMGYGIKCAGQMASQIYNNTMNKDFYGFWLDHGGYVGEQNMNWGTGVVYPSYNKWANIPWGNNAGKRTFTSNNTNGASSPIDYRTGNPLYNPNPTGFIAASAFTLTPTTVGTLASPVCTVVAFNRHSPVLHHLLQSAQDIAMDNINFPGNDANSKWLNKQGLLVNIQTESIDVSGDGILQGFVNQSATDNLGKLTTLNNIIIDPAKHDTTDMIAAQALNASIAANNDIETNQKLLNDIVINNYLSNITNYTSSQLNDLRVLASKCPFTDGLAVYQARVMLSGIDTLGTEYYNACETDGDVTRMSYTNTDASQDGNATLLVYPNPATNQLTVNYQIESTDEAVFEIYNLIGEKVMLQKLSAGENEQTFSVAQLSPGVYFYKYSINDQIVKTDKLVIVK